MKSCSGALQTFIESHSPRFVADLYKFSLVGGLTAYYTSFGQDITLGGHTYVSSGPYLTRSSLTWSLGASSSGNPLTINLFALAAHTVGSVPILKRIAQGDFDGADVVLYRMYFPVAADGTPDMVTGTGYGRITLWGGSVSDVKQVGRTSAQIECMPYTELLNVNIPQDVFQPACRFSLFDARCALNRASFATAGIIQGGSTPSVLQTNLAPTGTTGAPAAPTLSGVSGVSGVNQPARTLFVVVTYVTALGETLASAESSISLSANQVLHVASPAGGGGAIGWNCYVAAASSGAEEQQNTAVISIGTAFQEPYTGLQQGATPPRDATDGYFALGVVEFTSGALNGIRATIEANSGSTLTLRRGLTIAPSAGDTFNAYPGCDKKQSTCGSSKFNNLIHFGGFPFVPPPENGL